MGSSLAASLSGPGFRVRELRMSASATFPPSSIPTVEVLEEQLSEPTPAVVEALAQCDGDLLVLGVGGKMGPTLARMAARALKLAGSSRRVIGVSRFSDDMLERRLNEQGVETIQADLLDHQQLARLPEAPNVVCMTGMKFGSSGQQPLTWAMNVYLSGMIAERFAHSRIVAFSTGNVYPLVPVTSGGSREEDEPGPVGEYATTAMGRERIFTHFSTTLGFPLSIVRLNYANELRYGVLADLARRVLAGQPIDLAMGNFNAIWQGDANAMALASLAQASTPPFVFNLAGPELLSVRRVCEQFGRLLDRPVQFVGQEAGDALLSNSQRAIQLFGYPRVSVGQMIEWIADWVRRGGASLDKPTHFETRDGRF